MNREDAILSEIGDGRLVKMDVDYTSQVDKAIPEAEKLAQSGQLQKALEGLYLLEKQTRVGADMRSNTRIQICIVQLCFKEKNWDALNENIVALSKKRSLIKQAICKMVQECCEYVDKTPDKETCLKLIDTLRTVTAGKIYVEVERARLTYKLCQMREKDATLDEAATSLLEFEIETYGTKDRKEKVELLLEQMRLCLARKDYVLARIISRKVSTKFFDDVSAEIQNLKVKYFTQMIQLDQNDANYLAISRHCLAISNTPIVKCDEAKLDEDFKESIEAHKAYLAEMPRLSESIEMALSNKEVIEEHKENLKERVEEPELELELLKNEMPEQTRHVDNSQTLFLICRDFLVVCLTSIKDRWNANRSIKLIGALFVLLLILVVGFCSVVHNNRKNFRNISNSTINVFNSTSSVFLPCLSSLGCMFFCDVALIISSIFLCVTVFIVLLFLYGY